MFEYRGRDEEFLQFVKRLLVNVIPLNFDRGLGVGTFQQISQGLSNPLEGRNEGLIVTNHAKKTANTTNSCGSRILGHSDV